MWKLSKKCARLVFIGERLLFWHSYVLGVITLKLNISTLKLKQDAISLALA